MRNQIICFLIAVSISFTGCSSASSPTDTVSLKSLLNEMVDRNALAVFPVPLYRSMQVSSWDRSQKNKNDKEGWFANKDYDYFIRLEKKDNRKEYVIMDAQGPGAITRWWIPQESLLKHRILRIYIDNNPDPVIEENYQDFINGSSRVKWPFAFTSSDEKDVKFQYSLPVGFPKQVGAGFYLPIPFSKGCKVTLDDMPFYYVIDYRLYHDGTKVIPFSKESMQENSAGIKSAGMQLLSEINSGTFVINKVADIAKGQSVEIDLPAGEHAIQSIQMKMASREKKQMNRGAVIMISFDGQQTVCSPVSEFFGGGVYARPVKNSIMEVTDDGRLISNWCMPYQKSGKIILKNFGDETIAVTLDVSVKDYKWTPGSMYFHADWHEDAPLKAPPKIDWNYIEIKGKGKYVGDVLTVYSIPKGWWGEGDEKIYIDGETFPSHAGTGLEDYYGYAWGMANYFNSPFISTSARDARGKGDWRGYNTVARMRLLDDIVFSNSLKLDIEAWLVEPGVSYSVCTFWYGIAGATDNIDFDESAVKRILPGFHAEELQKTPGEEYPDIAENQQLTGKGSGHVNYAGNQLNLLEWRNKTINKPLDGDNNNELGSEGYFIAGARIIKNQKLWDDSVSKLPGYIVSFSPQHISTGNQNAYLPFPETPAELHSTGLIEVKGDVAEKGLLFFTIGDSAPFSLRLGVMLDNADSFDKVGKYLWLTNNRNGFSPKISLVRSNRIPDWYFFDITDLKKGDMITIHGMSENNSGIFTMGAVTFDLLK